MSEFATLEGYTGGEPLRAYGPLRFEIPLVASMRVKWTREGVTHTATLIDWGRAFNGVNGIHAYARVRPDVPVYGGFQTVKTDELRAREELETSDPTLLFEIPASS